MENTITPEEARNHQSISLLLDDVHEIKSKNIVDLIESWEYELCYKYLDRYIYDNCDVLPYCINNVASVMWSPKRIWTFACDLCYSYSHLNANRKLIADMVWFIIDEFRYYDYLDDDRQLLYVEWLTRDMKLELFYNRLYNRFIKPLWDRAWKDRIKRYE